MKLLKYIRSDNWDTPCNPNPNPNPNPQIYHQLPFILSHSRDTLLTNLDWIASPDIPIITLSPHTLTDIPLMTPLIHPHLYY